MTDNFFYHMKLHLTIMQSFVILLIFTPASAFADKDGIEFFETKDVKTWGAFVNAVSDSVQSFINGRTCLKEVSVLKNTSNGETVFFRVYDIKYKPDIDGAIVVNMSKEGLTWAKTKKPIVTLPFTNNKIRLVSTCGELHQVEWMNIEEVGKLFSKLANNNLFILAADSNLQLEAYWRYYKPIHNAIGASNIETLYEDSLSFCSEEMIWLCASDNSINTINDDIILLSRLLWLPKEYHTAENLTNLKQICRNLLQYKKCNSEIFEKLMICYGCLIINALNYTQWTF